MHLVLVIGKFLVLTMGGFIAYRIYRGSVQNDSPAMRFLASGFLMISMGAALEGVLYEFLDMKILIAEAIQSVIVAGGMLLILYSLYGNHRTTTSRTERVDRN